ncbi:hypothetical protein SAMN05444161_9221 [Rhizobiales bacterium GAS191]|nr:hypothetical protein SAMN05444161_9221 [Rhizobiales bacterium GAS191]
MKLLIFRLAAFAVTVASGLGSPTHGQEASQGLTKGESLYQACVARRAGCDGYVQGVVDTIRLGGTTAFAKFCLPSGATPAEVTEIATDYLRTHPERQRLAGAQLVAEALSQAFPCK